MTQRRQHSLNSTNEANTFLTMYKIAKTFKNSVKYPSMYPIHCKQHLADNYSKHYITHYPADFPSDYWPQTFYFDV